MMLTENQDAFGHVMCDYLRGIRSQEIIERDDGLFSISPGPALYFAHFDEWPSIEQKAIAYARGRVLDVGCGAGRHSLYLQERGLDVLGVDNSPLCLEVCRQRGVRQVQGFSVTQLSSRLGVFDTILMLANNFCLIGSPRRARWLLRRMAVMTTTQGRILAGLRNPYGTDQPEHLEYHALNRSRGRLSGEARIRVRYKKSVTPWIEFLMLSPDELSGLLIGTPWRLDVLFEDPGGNYVAVLEKSDL
jgi:SAM-dependent methyltransferase